MAVTQLKDGRWICYFPVKDPDGKQKIKREYFGRGTEGEEAARKRNESLGLKKRRPTDSSAGPSFGDLAEVYLANKKLANEKAHELLTIRLTANILPYFENKTAIRLKDSDMDGYIKYRRNKLIVTKRCKKGAPVKYSTINRELSDVQAILNYAVSRNPKLIPYNPVRDYKKPPVDDEVIIPPTEKEIKKIIENAASHLVRAITLSYYLGLRPGAVELLGLTWADVNLGNNSIFILSAQKGGPEKRVVPIHPELREILKQWKADDKNYKYIIRYNKKPVKSIKNSWKNALARAGIKRRLRPYDIRHQMITQALEQGADIKALSEVVGSSPETLRRSYQHVTSELKKQTIAKIKPLPTGNILPKKPK